MAEPPKARRRGLFIVFAVVFGLLTVVTAGTAIGSAWNGHYIGLAILVPASMLASLFVRAVGEVRHRVGPTRKAQ
jgi:hypothetical protein